MGGRERVGGESHETRTSFPTLIVCVNNPIVLHKRPRPDNFLHERSAVPPSGILLLPLLPPPLISPASPLRCRHPEAAATPPALSKYPSLHRHLGRPAPDQYPFSPPRPPTRLFEISISSPTLPVSFLLPIPRHGRSLSGGLCRRRGSSTGITSKRSTAGWRSIVSIASRRKTTMV